MDAQNSTATTQQEREEVIRHLRGYNSDGSAMLSGTAGLSAGIGGAAGGLGSLLIKDSKGKTDWTTRALISVGGAMVGWAIGLMIKQNQIDKEMDKKAANILFGDRILKERANTTENLR